MTTPSRLPDRSARRWPLSRIIGAAVLVISVFSVVAMAAGGLALGRLDQQRGRVENIIDPAALDAQALDSALLNQETGLRGYALSGQQDFLAPYTEGLAAEESTITTLRTLVTALPAPSAANLETVIQQAHTWRIRYAEPLIKQVAASGKPVVSPDILAGKAYFDALRARLAAFQADVSAARAQTLHELNDASDTLQVVLIVIAVVLAAIVVLLAVALRRSAIRPLYRLAASARRVADGDFGHEVVASGPREVDQLAADVNRMRERILAELTALHEANEALTAHATDLQRSNAELEQFAYVASHDLQEPLRKVTSFCQLLQRRYAGQLDERADQYIEFAVDGAKRMQVLINDLLAFSRVGRSAAGETGPVSCAAALAAAQANLENQLTQSGATVTAGPLPVVSAQLPLMTAVFQNLLGNAIKFRGEAPPRVSVTAAQDGTSWVFAVSDNGIGISAEYAERIFVIFQRLHDRATYPGTGIGLAMCRKIIEYFGGRIWLDTDTGTDTAAEGAGAVFRFTLPVLPEYPSLRSQPELPQVQESHG
ncbi:sensor histidine kinase [Trebonia sp.]|uniref:sensor histidine kinase n=1 Tax=Trebonia sp. TaxID=2767075 RepID=UPI003CC6BC81